jgi:hypothetical protein
MGSDTVSNNSRQIFYTLSCQFDLPATEPAGNDDGTNAVTTWRCCDLVWLCWTLFWREKWGCSRQLCASNVASDEHGLQVASILAMPRVNRNIFSRWPRGTETSYASMMSSCCVAEARCTVGDRHKPTNPSSPYKSRARTRKN